MFTILKMLRQGKARPHQASVAMLGVKPGDTVLVVGASHPGLAAAIAGVTGLNGQTTVADRADHAQERVERAAADAGTLVEFVDAPRTMLPLDSDRVDLAVLPAGLAALGPEAPVILGETIRAVRPGGRVAICEPVPRPGLFRLAQTAPVTDPAHVVERLTAAGLRAARHLGTIEGVAYLEAAKSRK